MTIEEKRDKVRNYVWARVKYLTDNRNTGVVKGKLANLRRGAGKEPGEIPELWGEFLSDLPEEMQSKNGVPTESEWAIYLSLTMFAVAMQGVDSANAENVSIGKAMQSLIDPNGKIDDERERVMRRFGPLITSKDMNEFSNHLRGLIKLISSKDVKLDYSMLAKDIYDFQFDTRRKSVQLKWAQDFYRFDAKNNDNTKGEN